MASPGRAASESCAESRLCRMPGNIRSLHFSAAWATFESVVRGVSILNNTFTNAATP